MIHPGFEDILEPRRREVSTWAWASRALRTQVAYKKVPRPTPNSHKIAVLRSYKISELIDQICAKENVKREEVERQLIQILDEIGYTKTLKVLRVLAYTLSKIFLKVCSGVYINYEALYKIKSDMGCRPVIFLPSHRSYADFIIFSYVFFFYDLEIPAIAAGSDFQGMMGMGEMLRHTGAFFMRRTFSNDNLYWAAFKEYVHQMVCNGDLPIEFFIEGTRSRSNKSMAPKYGLINMILKAYFLSQVPDILFVPVSVNYDRILEDRVFAFELLGIPKPRETTSGFFKSLTILKEHFGNIFFQFGEPISARDFLEPQINRIKYSQGPLHLHEVNEEEKRVVPSLSYEIVRRQQVSTVLSYFNLVALILNNNITRGQNLTSSQELNKEIGILREALRSWGATIFEQDIEEAVKECLVVHQNLVQMQEDGALGLVTNKIVVGHLDHNKLKAHALSEETITYSVPFMMLQIYANPVLHYLVDGALIVIVLRSVGKLDKDELYKHFYTLRAIFSFEFVLSEALYKMHFEQALVRLSDQNIISCENNQLDIFENNYFEEVLISCIQPFILTYYVVIEILLKLPDLSDEKTILSSVQKLLEDAISEKKIFIHPYCMSLDTLGNCLASLVKIHIAKKSREGDKNVYEIDKDSIKKFKFDLESYIPSFHVIKNFDIFLHIKSKL
ncbi:dihydroxyacetone phosphate acyltransferase [Euwallacea similis]|uniref:dihydroxyacetone phosphate acyltransferase n=1 Tax=Euwallacea similis TaxID=1736056 RepID=UPI00344BC578